MSASPATQGYMNGRPKLLILKKDTCSNIRRHINQFIPQLCIPTREFSLAVAAASVRESRQEIATLSSQMRNFYE
jgi:hypothetical protein